jgi:hypothetical protein
MPLTMRPGTDLRRAACVAAAMVLAVTALGGCSVIDRIRPGARAEATPAKADAKGGEQIDVRRYIGPDYCPAMNIVDGAQLIRTYERGHDGDKEFVKWQASIGNTARECLYDLQGNLTLKIGISGRAILGPVGAPDTISLPLKIAVVKYQESVLDTEKLNVSVTIPASGSSLFKQVKEIRVPSPGNSRDYVVYVGFDANNWDPMHPEVPVAAAKPPPPPKIRAPAPAPVAAAAPPPPQQKKSAPNELPVPEGYVFGQ